MPNRLIREGLLTSEKVDALPIFEQNIYFRLLLKVDDAGRFDGRPEIIFSALYPLGDSTGLRDKQSLIKAVQQVGLLICYEFQGKSYIQLTNWQKTYNSIRSKYPWKDGSYEIKFVSRETPFGLRDFVETSILESINSNNNIPAVTSQSSQTQAGVTHPPARRTRKPKINFSNDENVKAVVKHYIDKMTSWRKIDDSEEQALANVGNIFRKYTLDTWEIEKQKLIDAADAYFPTVENPKFAFKCSNFYGRAAHYLVYMNKQEHKEEFKSENGKGEF